MSDERNPRIELRDRLIWLRTLGVEDIAANGPLKVAAGKSGTAAGDKPTVARDGTAQSRPEPLLPARLFESQQASDSTTEGKSGRRTDRQAAIAGQSSPLASARAPDAPDATSALALIRDDLGDCQRCRLHEKRTNIVFGVGDPNAKLMFIGEGPGADEDRCGEPFVGRAGQLLTRIIEAMGLRRDQVYIANVVKCRPPENRTPLPDEVITCSPFLFQQAAAIRPRVIVCLGTPAAQTVLATRETITRMRGTFREVNGINIMPTFHPAYLLRNPAAKRDVWEDMKKVVACLKSEE